MYLPTPKTNFTKLQTTSHYMSKQNIPPSKFTIYPPKMHRVASTSYIDPTILHNSISKDFKPYRDFSKSKENPLQPNFNTSFNSTYDIGKFNTKNLNFSTHRYSCNVDIDRNSDNARSTEQGGTENGMKNLDVNLESRVRQLEEKVRKNQESLKFYCQQIEHFKNQFSSSSSHLLDSVNNTNVLTVSTREPLRQVSSVSSNTLNITKANSTTNISNKQNLSKNIPSVDSVTNSPKESEVDKKLKQIDQVKKDIKKLMGREELIKGDMKAFQTSIKEVLTGFREYLEKSTQGLGKAQEKNRKKMFDKINEEMNKRFKELIESELDPLKKMIENIKPSFSQPAKVEQISIIKSSQKFIKDPILIKLKEEAFCLVKKSTRLSPFESYQDMIKRSIYQAMGKPNHHSASSSSVPSYPRMSDEIKKQRTDLNYDKVSFEETEVTYYIDDEGYLLDFSGYYLLSDNQKIQLSQVQINKLKENQILKEIHNLN